jgi:hypothetical protein
MVTLRVLVVRPGVFSFSFGFLLTGPCFMLYNSMLRGFGNCGEVPAAEDVEYSSERFWQLLALKTVASRLEAAGHRFASTMHVLASGIKKLQIIAEDGQGTCVFRGLGKHFAPLFTRLYYQW